MEQDKNALKSKFFEVEELIKSAHKKREQILCALFQMQQEYHPGDIVKFTSYFGTETGVLSIPRMNFHSVENLPRLWVVHTTSGAETFVSEEQIVEKSGFDESVIDTFGHWRV